MPVPTRVASAEFPTFRKRGEAMRKPLKPKVPRHASRQHVLTAKRNVKMASSTHAYVRGNTVKFYDWLKEAEIRGLPEGPAIWICGDCHTGNLGPIANSQGKIEDQIRDLDQTVIGNPVHDLDRLGLSLATAARIGTSGHYHHQHDRSALRGVLATVLERDGFGRLRYAVLLDVDGGAVVEGDDLCLIDIKEGVQAAAPRYADAVMPRDNAERVVEGARHLSPHLGERMRSATLQDRPVVLRELFPEAMEVARYLALVGGPCARTANEPR
jgi:uncharacterized protein (DUF2252 family)